MAEMYLELTPVAGTPLPPIRWLNGSAPSLPIDYSKQTDKSSMLSGAQRFNLKSKQPRRWSLEWEMLTVAEFAALKTKNGYNQALYFQNNWEDMTWHLVIITSFEYTTALNLGPTPCRYGLKMSLEEVL